MSVLYMNKMIPPDLRNLHAGRCQEWIAKRRKIGFIDLMPKVRMAYSTTGRGGPKSRLTVAQKEELSRIVEADPDPDKDGVVRSRCLDLKEVIRNRFGVDYHERTVGKILKEPGFSHISALSPPNMTNATTTISPRLNSHPSASGCDLMSRWPRSV